MTDRTRIVVLALALAVAAFGAYGQVGGHEFIGLDDPDYVTENPWVRQGLTWHGIEWAFTQDHVANWHPLTWLSHMLDAELFGLDSPGGHHLVNVFFHALSTVLLFLALHVMTRKPWPSVVVAALFALHPLHVESVAWVSERKDVLSAAFWMGTILAYAWYARGPSIRRYALVFVLLAIGLMAKSMLVTLPFVLLLLDHWPLRRREAWPRLLLEKLPLFGLTAASCVATVLSQGAGGAVSGTAVMTVAVRIENALSSYLVYLYKTVWPLELGCYYPHPAIVAPDSALHTTLAVTSGIVLLAVTALAIRFRRRFPPLLVGWLWYLGTLVPVIGLLQVGEQGMADRYTYLPLVGIFIVAAWSGEAIAIRYAKARTGIAVGGVIALAACTVLTWRQSAHWKGSISLFEHTVEVTDDNYFILRHLAIDLAGTGDLPRAAHCLEEARRIKPYDSETLCALGVTYAKLGREEEAVPLFVEALESAPTHYGSNLNLGISYLLRDDLDNAETRFLEASRQKPEESEPHVNLAEIHIRRGENVEACRRLETVLQLWPDMVPALYKLGVALARLGEFELAAQRFARVVEEAPEYAAAHKDLGLVLLRLGDQAGATQCFRRALEVDPGMIVAANQLAVVLATSSDARLRDGAEAVRWAEHCAKATAYRNPGILATLAAACAEAGRFEDAEKWQLQAIDRTPPEQQPRLLANLALYRAGKPFHQPTSD